MSEDEMFVDNMDNEEYDDEYDSLIEEELIALVKANPALYAKNWKEYAGKDFCKDLAWNSIGSCLSKQMSGKEAAKLWYNVRQKFGRERRKVIASNKGKSGQERKPLYVPKWQFYSSCLFLVDHIMPRRTASNYTSNKNIKEVTTIGKTSFSPVHSLPSPPSSSLLSPRSTPSPQALSSPVSFPPISPQQALLPQTLSPQTTVSQTSPHVLFLQAPWSQALSPQATSSQASWLQVQSSQTSSPQTLAPQAQSSQAPSRQTLSSQASVFSSSSSVQSSDSESIFNNDTASISTIEDSNGKKAFLHASTSSPSSQNVKNCSSASVTVPSSSEEMLKMIQKTSTKRIAPEPDQFAKRKKKDDDVFMQVMSKQSTALTSFATKLEQSLVNSGQCSSTAFSTSSTDDPVLIAIGYALKSVPEDKRLECMLDLLHIIKSKYVQQ